MTIQFSSTLLDKFIAPHASQLTAASIPDMSASATESDHWISNFFLNSAMSVSFKPPMNAYAFNFLRRSQFAFFEHKAARNATLNFIEGGSQSPTLYCEALHHWESFVGQSWHGYSILLKVFKGKAFTKGDGSTEERLNQIYNQMKHVESRIACNQIPTGATVPVWLTNVGLESVDAKLSYSETPDVLNQLAVWADALMNPSTAKSSLDN